MSLKAGFWYLGRLEFRTMSVLTGNLDRFLKLIYSSVKWGIMIVHIGILGFIMLHFTVFPNTAFFFKKQVEGLQ